MTTRTRVAGALALALAVSFPVAAQPTPTPAPAPGAGEKPAAAEPAESAPAPTPQPTPGPVEPTGLVPLDVPLFGSSSSPVTSGTAFNPAISVIPDLVYSRDGVGGGAAALLEDADGFHGPRDDGAHAHGVLDEGFALRETEIAFTASVDPYFDVAALFSASEDGFEAEEVWARTRRLPAGLAVKAGKLLSGFGYANAHHPHQWDFVDASLAQTLLLGERGLNEKGLQVTWLPKLPFYLQVGVELLQGENGGIASYEGPVELSPGVSLRRKAGPRLFTGFAKLSPDLGFDAALQLGASYARSTLHQELHDEDGDGAADRALQGTVDLYGLDAVLKLDSPRPNGAGDLVLQAEYLLREKRLDSAGGGAGSRSRQDGLYAQAIYGFAPRWQAGLRWDAAGLSNSLREEGETRAFGTSKRWTAALTFSPSEFSRLRAQYERGDVPVSGTRETYDRLVLQLQLSVGAHGAHAF